MFKYCSIGEILQNLVTLPSTYFALNKTNIGKSVSYGHDTKMAFDVKLIAEFFIRSFPASIFSFLFTAQVGR